MRTRKNGVVRDAIIAAVTRLGEATARQVAEATGISKAHAHTSLSELTCSGVLDRVSHGVYRLSVTFPRVPAPALQSLRPLPYREAVTELAVRARNLLAALGVESRDDPRTIMLAVATKHIEDALDLWNGSNSPSPLVGARHAVPARG